MKKSIKPIDKDDIKEFLRQASELRDCSIFKNPQKIKIGITWNEKDGLNFSDNMPGKEAIKSLVVTIRPFIEYEERLHVGRVINYLIKKYGASKILSAWQEVFNGKGEENYPAIQVNGKEYRMREMLVLYMYGKYIHLDKEKQEVYRAFENAFGSLAEFYALSQLEKYAGVVFFVAGYIRKNKIMEL